LQSSKFVIVSGSEKRKRKRIVAPVSSSSDEADSSDDDDPDPASYRQKTIAILQPVDDPSPPKIPKKHKAVWSCDEMKNLRRNFRYLETIDDLILARLSFKEIVGMGGKRQKPQVPD
jgi:hypothetical protein